MYSDEKMILDIRMNVMNEYVDHFVIVESKYKHNGDIKNKNFDIEQCSKFKKSEEKMDITLMEWITLFAILDGPAMAFLYLLWRKYYNETQ